LDTSPGIRRTRRAIGGYEIKIIPDAIHLSTRKNYYFFSDLLKKNSIGANNSNATIKKGMPPSLCRELERIRGSTLISQQ